jgi:hypothetical protein
MAAAMTCCARPILAAPALLAVIVLSGCGGAIVPPPPKATFTPATPRPAQQALPQDQGAAGIIGEDARSLARLLGEPRLDIRDPAARKLQFSDGRCVLDAYLYPQRARREPVVAYAEARTSDGTTMDVAACVRELRAR